MASILRSKKRDKCVCAGSGTSATMDLMLHAKLSGTPRRSCLAFGAGKKSLIVFCRSSAGQDESQLGQFKSGLNLQRSGTKPADKSAAGLRPAVEPAGTRVAGALTGVPG